METALTLIIVLQAAIIGWILSHSSQCSAFHERVAALEEWKKQQEKK